MSVYSTTINEQGHTHFDVNRQHYETGYPYLSKIIGEQGMTKYIHTMIYIYIYSAESWIYIM